MRAEMEEYMESSTSSSETETTDSDNSTSESETQKDSEDSPRKQPSKKAKKTQSKKKKVVVEHSSPEQAQSYYGYSTLSEIGTEDLDEFLRENNEKSAAEGEKEADLRSTEGHYVSSETIPDVNLESDDPSSQGHIEQSSVNKPAESMLSLFVYQCPKQPLCRKMNKHLRQKMNQPLCYKFKELQKALLNPQQLEESTPTLPPAPSKINPAPEDAAALMMMAQTTSYVPKTNPMPSFSLGLTDSSQEETATAKTPKTPKLLEQLGDLVQKIASGGVTTKEKSPQIAKEIGAESFEKFETPARTNQESSDMKEKCYLWAIQVTTYADGLTNEFDNIVSAMCFILNQQKIKRFQEEVYYLPPDIVNMAIANHPQEVFLQPKNNKPFRVEDYPMFIPFLDLKKLASHHYGYVISRIKVYAGGAPLKSRDKDKEIVPPYLHISGQKTSYDCAIYVMKWLEIFEPANIKRRKYEWDNFTQHEVDHFRVEYASRILFHDMNLDKAEAIRGSNAIRLSKPSSLLLSPYCQIDSEDVDTA
ncbi:hypothetical protein Ahy_B05g075181 [Arachis hypogaea]|uniref:Ubiquitin-like protease family profile domain-containing protein n=1 Tax=Arachis hypogaea TaxID=3818 RepID=A0A444Z118_ARAHY|nr:hypothetical protein Ahy_B05g075181 [Arachis hypogaea]